MDGLAPHLSVLGAAPLCELILCGPLCSHMHVYGNMSLPPSVHTCALLTLPPFFPFIEDRVEKKRVIGEIESFKRKKAEFFNVTAKVESDDDIMASLRKASKNVTDVTASEDDENNPNGSSPGDGKPPGPPAPKNPKTPSGGGGEGSMARPEDVERMKKMFGGMGGDSTGHSTGDSTATPTDKPKKKRVSRFDSGAKTPPNPPPSLGGDGGSTGILDRPSNDAPPPSKPRSNKREGDSMTPEKPPAAPKMASDDDVERLKKLFGGE